MYKKSTLWVPSDREIKRNGLKKMCDPHQKGMGNVRKVDQNFYDCSTSVMSMNFVLGFIYLFIFLMQLSLASYFTGFILFHQKKRRKKEKEFNCTIPSVALSHDPLPGWNSLFEFYGENNIIHYSHEDLEPKKKKRK